MSVVIEINGRRRTLLPCASEGVVSRRLAILKGGAWVYAEVGAVHMSNCRAVMLGRRHGPCNCGAAALLRKVLSA